MTSKFDREIFKETKDYQIGKIKPRSGDDERGKEFIREIEEKRKASSQKD